MKSWGRSIFSLLVGAAFAAACASEEEPGSSEDDITATNAGVDAPIAIPSANTPLLDLTQSSLLVRLEKDGFALGDVLGAPSAKTNADLVAGSPRYASIVADLEQDMDRLRADDPSLKTEVSHGVTRIMDRGWLRANYASFELVGVINRADRLAKAAANECGEVRFIYRLAYHKGTNADARVSYSRLPFFINMVFSVPRTGAGVSECSAAAKKWSTPRAFGSADEYAKWLETDLLDLRALRFKQAEIDGQVVRVPSEVKTDMGGHAEYFLRVYRDAGSGKVEPAPLENTPDVERLSKDAALRNELAAYIKSHVAEADDGSIVLPEKFLARKVTSFTTFGSARLINKPFSRLFYKGRSAPELSGLSFANTKYVANVEGLLTRLDQSSCVGCHGNATSTAGFHFIGNDRLSESHPLNVLRVATSPHYLAEAPRRAAYLRTLQSGTEPSKEQPFAVAPRGEVATVGAACIPSEQKGIKAGWSCAAGLSCKVLTSNAAIPIDFGQCTPALNPAKKTYAHEYSGLPCLSGEMKESENPRKDVLTTTQFACPAALGAGYTCRPPSIGVPGGLCTKGCAAGNVPVDPKNELCAYAGGKEFDQCAAAGDFSTCIAGAIKSGMRQACDESTPCREDYICQKFVKARESPPEAPKDGRGYCVPTYFLFQVRTDGHPNPTPIR
ncbi:MAG: hypothetical protein U0174_01435 [Polyangiaceae bacterium]